MGNGGQQDPGEQPATSDGSRESDLAGKFVRFDATDWPVPGTQWVPLALDPAKSGTANSINDGSLSLTSPATKTTQSYPAVPSDAFNSDPPNTAIIGGDGPNQ